MNRIRKYLTGTTTFHSDVLYIGAHTHIYEKILCMHPHAHTDTHDRSFIG